MVTATAKENQTYCSKLVGSSQSDADADREGSPHVTAEDTVSKAPRTVTQSPTLPVADSHDLIRVQGASVNNLKDVSVEIPKIQKSMLFKDREAMQPHVRAFVDRAAPFATCPMMVLIGQRTPTNREIRPSLMSTGHRCSFASRTDD